MIYMCVVYFYYSLSLFLQIIKIIITLNNSKLKPIQTNEKILTNLSFYIIFNSQSECFATAWRRGAAALFERVKGMMLAPTTLEDVEISTHIEVFF